MEFTSEFVIFAAACWKDKKEREQKTSYMKCYKLIVYVDESFNPFSVALVWTQR